MEINSAYVPEDRYGFGENWRRFLELLDERRLVEAEESLRKLTGLDDLRGRSFLDIGSGSAIFSLAARRLGACVHSFDYDPASVACALSLRDRFFPNDPQWMIQQGSILDHRFIEGLGRFDIVYSWGVLHHTGAMYDAIRNASRAVAPNGLFVFALYRRTRLCNFWRVEKRWYSNASSFGRGIVRRLFEFLMRLDFFYRRKDFEAHVANYASVRGMDYHRDLDDWLGGYPYESISPSEVAALMTELGFCHVRSNVYPSGLGLFGSGCDEFVYQPAAAR